MSIMRLAQLDPSEAFPALEEESYQDENSFLACYLDGLAGDDNELEEGCEWWGSDDA